MATNPTPDVRVLAFAEDLEGKYGIPASTWRYWASVGEGPPSFLLGRRRVWKIADVEKWIEQQARADA